MLWLTLRSSLVSRSEVITEGTVFTWHTGVYESARISLGMWGQESDTDSVNILFIVLCVFSDIKRLSLFLHTP